jgi:hypothetical protein
VPRDSLREISLGSCTARRAKASFRSRAVKYSGATTYTRLTAAGEQRVRQQNKSRRKSLHVFFSRFDASTCKINKTIAKKRKRTETHLSTGVGGEERERGVTLHGYCTFKEVNNNSNNNKSSSNKFHSSLIPTSTHTQTTAYVCEQEPGRTSSSCRNTSRWRSMNWRSPSRYGNA